MALTDLQKSVMHVLARNRSETSYVAGGLALNKDWPRMSDDIDIFHDTDEEIGASANRDIATLEAAGFEVYVDVRIYGCVEARVRRTQMSETIIQWMSETRYRYFPLVRDEQWGARLHQADLAVNKILAASSRTKARDYIDLVSIADRYCSLGPLIMAAAGKPPYFSPQKIVEEIRRRGLSIPDADYRAVKGLSPSFTAADHRSLLMTALNAAEAYIAQVPVEAAGGLTIDDRGNPVEVSALNAARTTLRRPTAEPEVMPAPADASPDWGPVMG